jgi:hypothetical protein
MHEIPRHHEQPASPAERQPPPEADQALPYPDIQRLGAPGVYEMTAAHEAPAQPHRTIELIDPHAETADYMTGVSDVVFAQHAAYADSIPDDDGHTHERLILQPTIESRHTYAAIVRRRIITGAPVLSAADMAYYDMPTFTFYSSSDESGTAPREHTVRTAGHGDRAGNAAFEAKTIGDITRLAHYAEPVHVTVDDVLAPSANHALDTPLPVGEYTRQQHQQQAARVVRQAISSSLTQPLTFRRVHASYDEQGRPTHVTVRRPAWPSREASVTVFTIRPEPIEDTIALVEATAVRHGTNATIKQSLALLQRARTEGVDSIGIVQHKTFTALDGELIQETSIRRAVPQGEIAALNRRSTSDATLGDAFRLRNLLNRLATQQTYH